MNFSWNIHFLIIDLLILVLTYAIMILRNELLGLAMKFFFELEANRRIIITVKAYDKAVLQLGQESTDR